jgi:cellulose synthase/poly-beta-1,6-N-acetylglucosamine synthase-like glycosyltransferase
MMNDLQKIKERSSFIIHHSSFKNSSFVSILIAARDESANVISCLSAIYALDFPEDKLEILIGDDASTDDTAALVRAFIANKPNSRLISITTQRPGLRGKANVLAQLAELATGDFLAFTDADTRVPPGWLTGLLTAFGPQTGIVSGATLPAGPRFFDQFQALDWLYNLTLIHALSRFGVPLTALGNNMMVRRMAYDAVGGYAVLPFSVVEDFALFRAITKRGFGFANLLDVNGLSLTNPAFSLGHWLQQRKRWMRGAMAAPGWIVAGLYGQYLLGPLGAGLAGWHPGLAVWLFVLTFAGQWLTLAVGMTRLKQHKLWAAALLFPAWQLLIGPLAVLNFWLPTALRWKDRTY